MPNVIRLNSDTYPVEPGEREALAQVGANLVEFAEPGGPGWAWSARSCDGLIVVSAKVTGSIIASLEKCRIIARAGSGVDNIDIDAATARGILVSNVPDFGTGEVADHAMALLLGITRRMPMMMRAMAIGDYSVRRDERLRRVAGRTLGLIGFGRTARALALRARAFGLRLLAFDPAANADGARDLSVELTALPALLTASDFVSLHLPLTPQTYHLIDAKAMATMKRGAILINVARGGLVDDAAIADALRSGQLAGAGLDVHEHIDCFAAAGTPPSHELLDLARTHNLILTPHCAGSSVEAAADSKLGAAQAVVAVLSGDWPESVINPQVRCAQSGANSYSPERSK